MSPVLPLSSCICVCVPCPFPEQVQDQFREIVLDARLDEFYRKHMYCNYGDVGLSVKALVDKFSSTSQQHKKVRSPKPAGLLD